MTARKWRGACPRWGSSPAVRFRRTAIEIVLARAPVGAKRAGPLQVAQDGGRATFGVVRIKSDFRHALRHQIGQVRPFAGEDAQVTDPDAASRATRSISKAPKDRSSPSAFG